MWCCQAPGAEDARNRELGGDDSITDMVDLSADLMPEQEGLFSTYRGRILKLLRYRLISANGHHHSNLDLVSMTLFLSTVKCA